MTQMFMGRAELMPAGESTEDHLRAKQEEAAVVERDKLNSDSRIGGLFRGCFRGRSVGHHGIIQDVEDGVERCPNCAWELEEGYCDSCGINYGTDMESYYGDSIPSEFDQSETDMTASDDFHEHGPDDFHDERSFHTQQDPLNDWTGTGPAEVGDDISLDGDGQALHAVNAYNGDFAFERAVAQALTGRPIRRNGSPVTAHTPRHYAPSMLSEVTTTYSEEDGFSEMEGGNEVDESGEDVDEDDEDDEDEEASLSGFIVHGQDEEDHTLECHLDNHLDRISAGSEDTDVQEPINNLDRFHHAHSNLQYWVDDSADETDSDNGPHLGNEVLSMENRVSSNSSNSSSEDEPPIVPQPSRKRRRIVQEISSEGESGSEEESVRSRPRRRLSSSGSATVGRQSPVQEPSRAIPNGPLHRRRVPATPAVTEPDPWESESDLAPMSPANNRTSRRRRSNNRRRPRLNRDNSNFANIHTSQPQRRARNNSSTMIYERINFPRMQPDLAPPPLAIRREGPSSRRHHNHRYV